MFQKTKQNMTQTPGFLTNYADWVDELSTANKKNSNTLLSSKLAFPLFSSPKTSDKVVHNNFPDGIKKRNSSYFLGDLPRTSDNQSNSLSKDKQQIGVTSFAEVFEKFDNNVPTYRS